MSTTGKATPAKATAVKKTAAKPAAPAPVAIEPTVQEMEEAAALAAQLSSPESQEAAAAEAAATPPAPKGRKYWGAALVEGSPRVASASSPTVEGARSEAEALQGDIGSERVIEARTADEALDVLNAVDDIAEVPLVVHRLRVRGAYWKRYPRLPETHAVPEPDEGQRVWLLTGTGMVHLTACRFLKGGAVDHLVGPADGWTLTDLIWASRGVHRDERPKGETLGVVASDICRFCRAKSSGTPANAVSAAG